MPEALPLIKPQQPDGPERAQHVPKTVSQDIDHAARIVVSDAPAFDEAVNKQAEQKNHATVIEQEGRAARQPAKEETRIGGPLIAMSRIPHRDESHKHQMAQHEVVVQIAGAEEDRSAEGVE